MNNFPIIPPQLLQSLLLNTSFPPFSTIPSSFSLPSTSIPTLHNSSPPEIHFTSFPQNLLQQIQNFLKDFNFQLKRTYHDGMLSPITPFLSSLSAVNQPRTFDEIFKEIRSQCYDQETLQLILLDLNFFSSKLAYFFHQMIGSKQADNEIFETLIKFAYLPECERSVVAKKYSNGKFYTDFQKYTRFASRPKETEFFENLCKVFYLFIPIYHEKTKIPRKVTMLLSTFPHLNYHDAHEQQNANPCQINPSFNAFSQLLPSNSTVRKSSLPPTSALLSSPQTISGPSSSAVIQSPLQHSVSSFIGSEPQVAEVSSMNEATINALIEYLKAKNNPTIAATTTTTTPSSTAQTVTGEIQLSPAPSDPLSGSPGAEQKGNVSVPAASAPASSQPTTSQNYFPQISLEQQALQLQQLRLMLATNPMLSLPNTFLPSINYTLPPRSSAEISSQPITINHTLPSSSVELSSQPLLKKCSEMPQIKDVQVTTSSLPPNLSTNSAPSKSIELSESKIEESNAKLPTTNPAINCTNIPLEQQAHASTANIPTSCASSTINIEAESKNIQKAELQNGESSTGNTPAATKSNEETEIVPKNKKITDEEICFQARIGLFFRNAGKRPRKTAKQVLSSRSSHYIANKVAPPPPPPPPVKLLDVEPKCPSPLPPPLAPPMPAPVETQIPQSLPPPPVPPAPAPVETQISQSLPQSSTPDVISLPSSKPPSTVTEKPDICNFAFDCLLQAEINGEAKKGEEAKVKETKTEAEAAVKETKTVPPLKLKLPHIQVEEKNEFEAQDDEEAPTSTPTTKSSRKKESKSGKKKKSHRKRRAESDEEEDNDNEYKSRIKKERIDDFDFYKFTDPVALGKSQRKTAAQKEKEDQEKMEAYYREPDDDKKIKLLLPNVQAEIDFEAGDYVAKFCGDVISKTQYNMNKDNPYIFQIGNIYIDGSNRLNFGVFIPVETGKNANLTAKLCTTKNGEKFVAFLASQTIYAGEFLYFKC